MNDSTRTFTAAYPIFLDDAVIAHASHTITVTGYGDSIQFAVDGRPVSTLQAEGIRQLALSRGTFERVSGPEILPIGKARAAAMHRELARRGYPTCHYDLASGVLGREIASLAALTEVEARTVWTCLIYGAGVAA